MTAADYLAHQTNRQLERLIEAVRAIPADRMNWSPTPGARSALNQLQEMATIGDAFPSPDPTKIEFTPEQYGAWVEDMASRTDIEALIDSLRDYTRRQIEAVRAVPTEKYLVPLENPFGADMKVIDGLTYHNWNMAYHEGQIRYIESLLKSGTV
ncbi:MAG: hypothetical protein EOP60_15325 [Sphingomonadales bacterium]|nr:MAG: hypothetical protein EOP60_15325 [Sphingomonadales bacterium]